ncbi:regulatory protein RecX [Microbacterium sp. TNHR37B]|uniref:regulatory protein RecX n=1 Tax=Microbacterium sp. TNHR37B TaxID=1775956 RepID=UPI0007B1D973|nr:regulatory protein RecX [Microbacterium sp. TNHR37B]KZE90180.1 Regulatory protein RecX [Microbacterium sp. TNHR37B]
MTDDITDGGQAHHLAPVIPLFHRGRSDERAPSRERTVNDWHTTWTASTDDDEVVRGAIPQRNEEPSDNVAAAEKSLLKKLRVRSLSVREAGDILRSAGVASDVADAIIDRCLRHGYLDDLRLAEQLVYTATERKGQGRNAIMRTLRQRGIDSAIAEAALSEVVDDDRERALEFARHKARAFRDVDRDTALRRLVGQLTRRGYSGSVAMAAARSALDEAAPTGVRFTE